VTGLLAVAASAAPQDLPFTLTMSHPPPSSAHRGTALALTATVSSTCGTPEGPRDCGNLRLTAYYSRPDGSPASVSVVGTDRPEQTLTVEIPANDVSPPSVAYVLVASQSPCGARCSDPPPPPVEVRSQPQGKQTVTVDP
jgi:hypothetical protein